MKRIIYGINGDGMGHCTRSAALIKELKKKYKIMVIVSSDRAYQYMKKRFDNVKRFNGIRLVYNDNSVSDYYTLKDFTKRLFKDTAKNVAIVYKTIKKFKPDIVITDFEHTTAYVANIMNLPLICICNVHSVTKMRYTVPKKYLKDYRKAKLVINIIYPKADYHLITTFFYQKTKSRNCMLFPPILRKEIQKINPQRKDYVLVYQTSKTNHKLINVLKHIDKDFIIYGFDRDYKDKNLTFKRFNEKEFLDDLGNCSACIANGGFSLVSEAVSLHKPLLSVPITGQFEQIINALHVKRLGYGEMHDAVDKKKIEHFLNNSDKYYSNLKHFKKEDNSRILKKIDDIISIETGNDNF